METEKEILNRDIENAFNTLLDELSKFDEETLNQVPLERSWTAGQTAEHIIICGSGIPDTKTTVANRAYDEKVNALRDLFLNFELKFEADPSIVPGPPPHRKDTLVQKIKEIRNHLKNIAETSDLTTLCVDMEFPSFGQLTRYEWLRFILFHTQRHTRQIVNIGKHLANA
ncbi:MULTISPECIES: DinB family protein [unclassified Arenibacter]|uniref:DinB family protein n=1 Tax=unclassified Arenibacter TaxID=2615047 RepID=UPI000E341316|nr:MULTISPECIES: DinB family protein [unclassified Arenibacter]MCM4164635.1 DinB family protein [Arenibacter sp. A80]RFT55716.1 DinB family protein [Arenibacter sp. P308M17]